jgi:ankyrin repeat protein
LHGASQQGDLEVAQLLLKFGADANALDDSNQAPLHLASREGHLEVVQLLVGRSAASIHLRNNKGRNPFQEASAGGHHDVKEFLLEHGAEDDVVE